MDKFYQITFYIISTLFGLCIGSFLNVVIYRLPNRMSLSKPASHCPICGYKLLAYDNIPVISYLMLKGKCRSCRAYISPRYTIVEMLNAVLWFLSAWLYYETSVLYAISVMVFCSLMICIGFIDLETMTIYDILLYITIIPIVMAIVSGYRSIWNHLISGAVGALVFLAIYLIFRLVRKKECMGTGDILLVAVIGGMLGYKALIFAVLIASVSGCAVMVPGYFRTKEREREYPFAPFLTFGAITALFATDALLKWYTGLLNI